MTTPTVSDSAGASPPIVSGGVLNGMSPFGDDTPPGVPTAGSSYLELLPGIYHGNEFLGRFLLIFEHILSPIERTVGNAWTLFDPGLVPAEMLPWLASWLSIVMDARLSEDRRRALIAAAPELYRWRGTARGMRHYIELYTGVEPQIIEPSLSDIAANRSQAYRFTVRLTVPRGADLPREFVESIIEAEKPAFAACSLELVNA